MSIGTRRSCVRTCSRPRCQPWRHWRCAMEPPCTRSTARVTTATRSRRWPGSSQSRAGMPTGKGRRCWRSGAGSRANTRSRSPTPGTTSWCRERSGPRWSSTRRRSRRRRRLPPQPSEDSFPNTGRHDHVLCLAAVTRTHKIVNLIGVPLPLVGLLAAIVLLWNQAIGPLELGLLVGLYVLTALGVPLGYHRMFQHRAFESSRAFRAIVAVFGSMAMQGSVITWVADHRKHHAFTDQDGDPHSPHLSGPGFWGGVKGLWHAHIGWLFESVGTADRERFAADLVKDRLVRGRG